MHDALIGYTGFVGGILAKQRGFAQQYRSTNVGELAGKTFDTIFCAGAPGQKWLANAKPEQDAANLARLMDALRHVQCKRMVLLSTVDVFVAPTGVDESSPTLAAGLGGYGRNRLALEQFVRSTFPHHLIVRLPGLVGAGLRKNALFDLLHRRRLQTLHPRSRFQFYPVACLWADLQKALQHGLVCIHLATEAVELGALAKRAFNTDLAEPLAPAAPVTYDLRTRHASLWNKTGSYLYDRTEVEAAVRAYASDAGERETEPFRTEHAAMATPASPSCRPEGMQPDELAP